MDLKIFKEGKNFLCSFSAKSFLLELLTVKEFIDWFRVEQQRTINRTIESIEIEKFIEIMNKLESTQKENFQKINAKLDRIEQNLQDMKIDELNKKVNSLDKKINAYLFIVLIIIILTGVAIKLL